MAGPTTAVTRTNVLAGAGVLYIGDFGAVEPADSAVNAAPSASAWEDMGGTNDGLTVTTNQEFFEMEVDQVPDIIGRRLTKRDVQVKTNLAEATLENLEIAFNDGTMTTDVGFSKLELANGLSAMIPTERAAMVDGWAPGTDKRRRFIARRVVSIDNIESGYKKDGMFLVPVTFGAMYVDSATSPCVWIDEE